MVIILAYYRSIAKKPFRPSIWTHPIWIRLDSRQKIHRIHVFEPASKQKFKRARQDTRKTDFRLRY